MRIPFLPQFLALSVIFFSLPVHAQISGKRHTFELYHDKISIDIPAQLKMRDPLGNPAIRKMMVNKDVWKLTKVMSGKLEGINYQVGIEVTETDLTSPMVLSKELKCENNKKPRSPVEVKAEWWNLGEVRACAVYTWEYEWDSPVNDKEDMTGEVILTFNHGKAQYRVVIGVRNLDEHNLKPVIMDMARSVRIGGGANDDEEKGNCKLISDKMGIPNIKLGVTSQRRFTIRKDRPMVLTARARDRDRLNLICDARNGCGAGSETSQIGLRSPVNLVWRITSETGRFAEIGSLPAERRIATGENALLWPTTALGPGESETIRIEINALDNAVKNGVDPMGKAEVTVMVRATDDPYVYAVEVTAPNFEDVADVETKVNHAGGCKAKVEYEPGNNLKDPKVILPETRDNNLLVSRERMVLRVKPEPDEDQVFVTCESDDCENGERNKIDLVDEVIYTWTVVSGNGGFYVNGAVVPSATGTSVIFEAPPVATGAGQTRISVVASNHDGPLKDNPSGRTLFNLNIFQGAIIVVDPPATYLPEHNVDFPLKTALAIVNPDNNALLRPALAHQVAACQHRLYNVSTHTGICTNWENTDDPEGRKLDLFFSISGLNQGFQASGALPSDEDRGLLAVSRSLLQGFDTLRIPVSVRDYGASGQVEVTGFDPQAILYRGRTPYSIPLDVNEDGIGDGSQFHNNRNLDEDTDDNDLVNNPANAGDGFTNWEEYRGFMRCPESQCLTTGHIRTDPRDRDLFVQSDIILTLDLFESAADIRAHFINGTHMNENRVLNHIVNTGQQHKGGDQCGVVIENGVVLRRTRWGSYSESNPLPAELGQTRIGSDETHDGAYLPCEVTKIVLNTRQIAADLYILEEVAAHELGHACGVPHHGDNDENDLDTEICVADQFSLQNDDCTEWHLMEAGTKYSGNMRCMMRYNFQALSQLVGGPQVLLCDDDCNQPNGTTRGNLRLVIDWPQGLISGGWQNATTTPRNIFCRNDGANSIYGACAAGRGSCYFRLRVKCW